MSSQNFFEQPFKVINSQELFALICCQKQESSFFDFFVFQFFPNLVEFKPTHFVWVRAFAHKQNTEIIRQSNDISDDFFNSIYWNFVFFSKNSTDLALT